MSNSPCKLQDESLDCISSSLKKRANYKANFEIVNVHREGLESNGEHYASQIFRVTVDLHSKDTGRKVRKSFIVKKALATENFGKLLVEYSIFQRELKIYTEILPQFDALMDENQDFNDRPWCKFISYNPNVEIILEDLKAKNFKLANRKTSLDERHGLLVMQNLARFHGISYVLLQQGLLDRTGIEKHFLELDSKFTEKILEGGYSQLACVMEQFWPPEWKEIAQKFANEVNVVSGKLKTLVSTVPEDAFIVIAHGDCWTCNMMFKYCSYDETNPIAVKFFDFQGTSIKPYILDLINFLFVSIKPEIRRQNVDNFLKEYQRSLKATLEYYGMAENAPTLQHVYSEYERFGYVACFYNLVFHAVTSADMDDAADMEKLATDCDAKESYNPKIFISETFRTSIEPDIKYWIQKGVI